MGLLCRRFGRIETKCLKIIYPKCLAWLNSHDCCLLKAINNIEILTVYLHMTWELFTIFRHFSGTKNLFLVYIYAGSCYPKDSSAPWKVEAYDNFLYSKAGKIWGVKPGWIPLASLASREAAVSGQAHLQHFHPERPCRGSNVHREPCELFGYGTRCVWAGFRWLKRGTPTSDGHCRAAWEMSSSFRLTEVGSAPGIWPRRGAGCCGQGGRPVSSSINKLFWGSERPGLILMADAMMYTCCTSSIGQTTLTGMLWVTQLLPAGVTADQGELTEHLLLTKIYRANIWFIWAELAMSSAPALPAACIGCHANNFFI